MKNIFNFTTKDTLVILVSTLGISGCIDPKLNGIFPKNVLQLISPTSNQPQPPAGLKPGSSIPKISVAVPTGLSSPQPITSGTPLDSSTIEVGVDPKNSRTLSPLLKGEQMNYYSPSYAQRTNPGYTTNGVHNDYLDKVFQPTGMGMTSLRFPGGTPGNCYIWDYPEQRNNGTNCATEYNLYHKDRMTFEQFMDRVSFNNLEPIVQLNLEFMGYPGPQPDPNQPQSERISFTKINGTNIGLDLNQVARAAAWAADWVSCANTGVRVNKGVCPWVRKDNWKKITHWELGNEEWAWMEAKQYQIIAKAYAQAIKAFDPSIQLIAVGQVFPYTIYYNQCPKAEWNNGISAECTNAPHEWNQAVIDINKSQPKALIDFIAPHDYSESFIPTNIPLSKDLDHAHRFSSTRDTILNAKELNELDTLLDKNNSQIKIAVTEWAPNFLQTYDAGMSYCDQNDWARNCYFYTVGNAIHHAHYFLKLLSFEKIEIATHHSLFNLLNYWNWTNAYINTVPKTNSVWNTLSTYLQINSPTDTNPSVQFSEQPVITPAYSALQFVWKYVGDNLLETSAKQQVSANGTLPTTAYSVTKTKTGKIKFLVVNTGTTEIKLSFTLNESTLAGKPKIELWRSLSDGISANPFMKWIGKASAPQGEETEVVELNFDDQSHVQILDDKHLTLKLNAYQMIGIEFDSPAFVKIQSCLNDPPSNGICNFSGMSGEQMLSDTLKIEKPVTLKLGSVKLASYASPLLTINSSNVTIEGLSHEQSRIVSLTAAGMGIAVPDGVNSTLPFEAIKNVTIKKLSIEGTPLPQEATYPLSRNGAEAPICPNGKDGAQFPSFGIHALGAENWLIENNRVTGWCNVGVVLGIRNQYDFSKNPPVHSAVKGSVNNRILNNQVEDNQGEGILAFVLSNSNTIEGNQVNDNGSNGIDVNGTNNRILRNTVMNNGHYCHTGDKSGIMLTPFADNDISGTVMSQNWVEGNVEFGLALGGSSSAGLTDNIFEDNDLLRNGLDGILLGNNVTTASYARNLIKNNRISFNKRHGVILTSGQSPDFSDNKITENSITNNAKQGVLISTPPNTLNGRSPYCILGTTVEPLDRITGNPEANVTWPGCDKR